MFPKTTPRELIFPFAGFQSKNLIVDAGLVLGDIEQHPEIDVTIDGADEYVDRAPPSSLLMI
jgi:ribose 5-phosphate isomerase A